MEIILGFASLVGCVTCVGILAHGLMKGKE